ncbi:DME family drug/metabolite transporter [Saccharothrix tamanrassetensis]|uniref:DME family drug/metabolite transporter n=1 Tax=Saccharothrix tamanrassetensis TaxID=1051531 RepID=A0A841CE43_9PSEU|nr:EamA family transporter [Saccharothrix tamanrassetensis]MBB5954026.1 DME family drug/metabolite transporter [Saccharothrix tamanrassetensis]
MSSPVVRARLHLTHGPLPILAACVLWGTTGTVSSLAPASAPASAVGAAGLVIGGCLLFLTARGTRTVLRTADHRLLALGALTVAGYALAFYPAVARTGVAVATTVALATAPIVLGLKARPLVTLTAVAGCAVLVLGGGDTHVDLVGVALALIAGLSYAAYSVICAHLIRQGHPSRAVVGTVFGGASILTLPVLLALGIGWIASGPGIAVVVHLSVFTTFAAYLLFGRGLRHTGAAAATTLTLAEPAVAAVLGVVVLHERLPLISWCGMALLGVALAALARPAAPATSTTDQPDL